MKVWIVEHEGKIVGASTDEVEACQYALIAGGYSRDAVANATLDGIVEAVESIGATVRQVDIAALERVAEAAREWSVEMVRYVTEPEERTDPMEHLNNVARLGTNIVRSIAALDGEEG